MKDMNIHPAAMFARGQRVDRGLRLLALSAIAAVLVFLAAQLVPGGTLLGLFLLTPAVVLLAVAEADVRWSLGIAFAAAFTYAFLCLLFERGQAAVSAAALLPGVGCVLAAAYITGRLSARFREQQTAHAEEVTRDRQLSDISTHLLTASSEELLCQLTLLHLYNVAGRPTVFYLFPEGGPAYRQTWPEGLYCYPTEEAAARAAFDGGTEAGFGTALHPESAFLYLPVRSGNKVLAVVGVLCDWRDPPEGFLVETIKMILVRVGVALDNQRLFRHQQSILMEKELEHMRTDFLRAISHDFRTPLTGIIGACTALSGDDGALDGGDRHALVDSIGEEAAWLLRMVENLLSVTRVGSSGPKLHKTPEPVEEVLSEALERTRKRFPALQIRIDQPGRCVMVPMDATLILQVLMNLIENACKYSSPDGVIDVTVTEEAGAVRFTVRDYGCGLSGEWLSHPFTPASYRAHDQRYGMGLGLSICRSVVTAHGGQIEAGNASSGGAVITFTLPKGEDDE